MSTGAGGSSSRRNRWKPKEDALLRALVSKLFADLNITDEAYVLSLEDWKRVSDGMPGRSCKQCRERWRNHLDPRLVTTPWTPQEDARIEELRATLGNVWKTIAEHIPGRSETAIKNRYFANARRAEQPAAPEEPAAPVAALPSRTSQRQSVRKREREEAAEDEDDDAYDDVDEDGSDSDSREPEAAALPPPRPPPLGTPRITTDTVPNGSGIAYPASSVGGAGPHSTCPMCTQPWPPGVPFPPAFPTEYGSWNMVPWSGWSPHSAGAPYGVAPPLNEPPMWAPVPPPPPPPPQPQVPWASYPWPPAPAPPPGYVPPYGSGQWPVDTSASVAPQGRQLRLATPVPVAAPAPTAPPGGPLFSLYPRNASPGGPLLSPRRTAAGGEIDNAYNTARGPMDASLAAAVPMAWRSLQPPTSSGFM